MRALLFAEKFDLNMQTFEVLLSILFIFGSNCISSADIENQIEHLDNHSNVKIELYDLYTNDTFLRAPFRQRRQPCECTGYKCSCCAGMNIKVFNFNRKLCTNFAYDPDRLQMAMNVMMNDMSLYENMFSGRNPPPLCLPIPIPYLPVAADMCFKLFNIFMPGRNLHMCLDMEARIQREPVLVLHFDCMRMGQDGVAFVKPEDNGGLPVDVDAPATHIDNNNPDPESPGDVDPPQTDYDIYDNIDEIKHKPKA